jgi:hypothetical protein
MDSIPAHGSRSGDPTIQRVNKEYYNKYYSHIDHNIDLFIVGSTVESFPVKTDKSREVVESFYVFCISIVEKHITSFDNRVPVRCLSTIEIQQTY